MPNRTLLSPRLLLRLLSPFAEFLFPRVCLVCGERRESAASLVCSGCWSQVGRITREAPLYRETFEKITRERRVADVVSAIVVERKGPLQVMIHALKYGGVTAIGLELGGIVADLVAGGSAGLEGVVSVPLHRVKQRERGYNQAEVIARGISSRLGIPMISGALVRLRYTSTQTHLGLEERRANLAGAFGVSAACRPVVHGKMLLLVDDVITTGSTITEAADVLVSAGAAEVIACSVAIARLESPWPGPAPV